MLNENIDAKPAEEALKNQYDSIMAIPEEDVKHPLVSGSGVVGVVRIHQKRLETDTSKLNDKFKELPVIFTEYDIRALAYWAAEKRLETLVPDDVDYRKKLYKEGRGFKKTSVKVLDFVGGDDKSVRKAIRVVKPGTGYVDCADDLAILHPHIQNLRNEIIERKLRNST